VKIPLVKVLEISPDDLDVLYLGKYNTSTRKQEGYIYNIIIKFADE